MKELTMSVRLRLTVLCLLLSAPALSPGQEKKAPPAAIRIALVGGARTPVVQQVLALAEPRISQTPGVELLERQAIDRVLAEQKLSLSGIVATDQAVTVGKLLSVDLFAVLETGASKTELAGFVIFDARTGVRLWDAALPSGDLDQAVKATVDGVRAALRKRGDKLRPICMMTVRNADLPRDLDGFCDSVGLLLERQLIASPGLAILERRRLEQVNRERDLPINSPLRPLQTSVVTVELEVGGSADQKGLRATALLSGNNGQSLGKVTATVADRDAVALSRALAKKLTDTLKVGMAPAAVRPQYEAYRFLQEAAFFQQHQDFARAVRAAESAVALQPRDPFARVLLTHIVLEAARTLLTSPGNPGKGKAPGRFQPDTETLARSLGLARRGSELLVEVESITATGKLPFHVLGRRVGAEDFLLHYLPRLSTLRTKVTAEDRAMIAAIRKNQDQALAIRLESGRKAVNDKRSFDDYTILWRLIVSTQGQDRALPPADWARLLCRLKTWAEVAREHENQQPAHARSLLQNAVESYGVPRPLDAADIDRLQKFWDELTDHPTPFIALYGRLGSLVNTLKYGKLSDEEARKRARAFRLYIQGALAKGDALSEQLRIQLYELATNAFASNRRLKLPGHLEERMALAEFMLQRKEVFGPLVQAIADKVVFFPSPVEESRSAHALLGRSLEVLEKGGRFLTPINVPRVARGERDRFCNQARQLQATIRQRVPTLGTTTRAPWARVTTLIDVQANKKGILWLQRPVVHEGNVYVAALQMEWAPRRFSIQLLRLTPGRAARMEGKSIPVSLRLPTSNPLPVIGPKRFTVEFASAACIHQGRYILGTREDGLFLFPLDGSRPEHLGTADGLPSKFVHAVTGLGDRLYVSLGERDKESYVAAWDLKTRKVEVLASSRRKEKQAPFDDHVPLHAKIMLADQARGRVLMGLFPNGASPLSGLWALDVRDKKWARLLPLQPPDAILCGPNSRVEGDRLVLKSSFGRFEYDLAKPTTKLILPGKASLEVAQIRCVMLQLENLPGYPIRFGDGLQAWPPHEIVGGQVWGAWPFSRRRLDNGRVENLPPLRPGPQFFRPSECIQLFRGERELLVGDCFGIWLVTLKD
jgi:hypothetical protein